MLQQTERTTDKQIEQQVLGSILLSPQAMYQAATMLVDKMFSQKSHQLVYAEMAKLHAAGKTVRRLAVAHALGDSIEGMNPNAFLSALEHAASKQDTNSLFDDIEMIADRYTRAETRRIMEKAAKQIADMNRTPSDIIEAATAAMNSLVLQSEAERPVSLYEAIANQVDLTADAYQRGMHTGYDLGLGFINTLTGPWLPGQLVTIGAPTKVGKSALAMQCATGLGQYGPVLYFSFEMNAQLWANREIAKSTKISTLRQRTGKVRPDEYEKMVDARDKAKALDSIKIVSKRMSASQIVDYARRYKKQFGLAGIVVDHLGLVAPEKGARSFSDWELAAAASPLLKAAAEELHCVVLAVSQVLKEHPGIGKMKDRIAQALRRPGYQDLKGSIANDADHVLMPFRPAALLSKIEPSETSAEREEWMVAMERVKDKAEIVLALSRESRWPRFVDVDWDGPATTFRDIIVEAPYMEGL